MGICAITTARDLQSSFIRLDAEFFRPEYIKVSHQIRSIPGVTPLSRLAERITQGSNPKFVNKGIACVNGKNVYFGTMVEGDPNYVSPNEFERLFGYALRRNDLVITLKHATKVGRVWIVEDDEPRIFSRNVGLVRLRADSPILPAVLLLYLWTKAGQLLIERCATGGTTGQITLPMSELRRLLVPPISETEQIEVNKLFWQSRTSARGAAADLEKAGRFLQRDLKLDKLTFEKPVGYDAKFRDLQISHRLDAQHYQPRFKHLIDHLSKVSDARIIRDIRTYNRRGVQPVYSRSGEIDVVNSQHLGPKHLDYNNLEKTTKEAFEAAPEAHIQPHDLLIYTTGAYIGRTNVYLGEAPAVGSNHVNILRLQPGIDSAYMALVFQSIIGQFQTQKHARGSAQAELYPKDIDRFIVPLIDSTNQKAIGDLVRESLVKEQQSQKILEEARDRVERIIEGRF